MVLEQPAADVYARIDRQSGSKREREREREREKERKRGEQNKVGQRGEREKERRTNWKRLLAGP
jgi:hypothetical protein